MTKQGTPTSGSAGLSPATTRHGTTMAGAQAEKQPALGATGVIRATPAAV